MASMGHVRDLPTKKLGVDIEHDFKPSYIIVPGKKKIIAQLKEEAAKAPEIILATDPDREGEAIAYHVAYLLKGKKPSTISRITFHEITKQAIEQSLKDPGKINLRLVGSQQARRVLDRLVGYKLSPLLWRKVRRGLSAGRVQSPAVRLVVEREREIKDFVPKEYWRIEVELAKSQKFLALLIKINDKKAEIKNKKQADKIVKDLKKAEYQVLKIKKEEVKKYPPPPFITSTLQRSASSVFGWSGKKTMREAQRLYEEGLITYHRTDSVNLAAQAIKQCRVYINSIFGKAYLPPVSRKYKTKSKLAQEAHEAIRVTSVKRQVSSKEKLGSDASRLYRLIFNRFVACQMKEQLLEKTTVDIEAERYLFRAIGEVEKFDGWRKLYQAKIKNDKTQKTLPSLTEGEPLDLIRVIPQQKFTQPPDRYTEGMLIKALEDRGIGRPSTYAPIISTIQARQYVEKIEGRFQPTPVGETVNDFLVKYFNNVIDYDFTAEMEDDLDNIAKGEKKWVPVVREFYQPFAKQLDRVYKNAKREKIKTESIGKKCPKCKKGEQVIRVGRFGKFLSCSRFPDCDWKAPYIEKVEGIKCPECGGEVVIKKTKKGKRFYGCGNYPKCKWASWRKPR